jgi:hypothetical protein
MPERAAMRQWREATQEDRQHFGQFVNAEPDDDQRQVSRRRQGPVATRWAGRKCRARPCDMPMAIPIGIASRQAKKKAEKTRNMLAAKCCHKGLSFGGAGQVLVELLKGRLRRGQEDAA